MVFFGYANDLKRNEIFYSKHIFLYVVKISWNCRNCTYLFYISCSRKIVFAYGYRERKQSNNIYTLGISWVAIKTLISFSRYITHYLVTHFLETSMEKSLLIQVIYYCLIVFNLMSLICMLQVDMPGQGIGQRPTIWWHF